MVVFFFLLSHSGCQIFLGITPQPLCCPRQAGREPGEVPRPPCKEVRGPGGLEGSGRVGAGRASPPRGSLLPRRSQEDSCFAALFPGWAVRSPGRRAAAAPALHPRIPILWHVSLPLARDVSSDVLRIEKSGHSSGSHTRPHLGAALRCAAGGRGPGRLRGRLRSHLGTAARCRTAAFPSSAAAPADEDEDEEKEEASVRPQQCLSFFWP